MNRLSIKGIVIGNITDMGLTFVLMTAVGIGAVLIQGPSALTGGSTGASDAVADGPLGIVLLVAGCVASILGGYVAGRVAGHDELLNGALSAILCVSIGLATLLAQHQLPGVRDVLTEMASPCLGLFGGYLRIVQKNAALKPRAA